MFLEKIHAVRYVCVRTSLTQYANKLGRLNLAFWRCWTHMRQFYAILPPPQFTSQVLHPSAPTCIHATTNRLSHNRLSHQKYILFIMDALQDRNTSLIRGARVQLGIPIKRDSGLFCNCILLKWVLFLNISEYIRTPL